MKLEREGGREKKQCPSLSAALLLLLPPPSLSHSCILTVKKETSTRNALEKTPQKTEKRRSFFLSKRGWFVSRKEKSLVAVFFLFFTFFNPSENRKKSFCISFFTRQRDAGRRPLVVVILEGRVACGVSVDKE